MTIIILYNWFKLFIILICLLNTITTVEASRTDELTDDSDFYLNSN
jgi:hypothetical protein